MTRVGEGGVVVATWRVSRVFAREYRKLTPKMQDRVDSKLRDLQRNPRPPGLGFEKLKGERNPAIYTIHITGNCKLSFELNGSSVWLRRVATHDEIDRAP